MITCFRCNKENEDFLFLEVITPEGVKKICRDCFHEERYPVIRKPIDVDKKIKNVEKQERASVYERLTRISGVARSNINRNIELEKENIRLKKIADRNYDKEEKEINPEGLVEHFNWIIMRTRKLEKITRNQLAQKIGESEIAVKLAEQGIVPKSYYNFIVKIENALNLNLMKPEFRDKYKIKKKNGIFNFNSPEFSSVKVKDLGNIKKDSTNKKDVFDENDLSDEEIDRILSGK